MRWSFWKCETWIQMKILVDLANGRDWGKHGWEYYFIGYEETEEKALCKIERKFSQRQRMLINNMFTCFPFQQYMFLCCYNMLKIKPNRTITLKYINKHIKEIHLSISNILCYERCVYFKEMINVTRIVSQLGVVARRPSFEGTHTSP